MSDIDHIIPNYHGAWAAFTHPDTMTCEHCGEDQQLPSRRTRRGLKAAARPAKPASAPAKALGVTIPEAELADAIDEATRANEAADER